MPPPDSSMTYVLALSGSPGRTDELQIPVMRGHRKGFLGIVAASLSLAALSPPAESAGVDGTIAGQVLDADGATPVIGATVRLSGAHLYAVTGESGRVAADGDGGRVASAGP